MEDLTPLYNKEFYLAYLCGEDVVLPIPDGNAERYLAYLCGMDVEIPDVPDGRTETYLAYKCGEDVVLPDPMYRIEYYLAKWCGIDCEVPEPMYRIEYWLAQLANSGELKTVTGNPISVSDALAKPAEALTIEILPQQSGSGDPSPDNVRPISGHESVKVTRTGKNLFDKSVAKTNNAYRQDDGTQASSTISCYTDALGGFAPSTAYTISGTVTVAGSSTRIYFLDAQQNWISRSVPIYESSLPYTFTTPAHCRFVQIQCPMSVSDLSDVQLELGSTATAYEPYTGTTYSISWQDEAGTVYGGTLDVTTGVLTVTKLMFTANTSTMNNSEAYPGWKNAGVMANNPKGGQYVNAIVNVGKAYAINVNGSNDIIYLPEHLYNHMNQTDWIALAIDVQIVYELATPQTYQLTPTQVQMLLGNNVIWNDVGGDMVLEYLADGPADDIDALNILLNNRYVNNGEPDEATDKEALEILLGGNTR